MTKLVVRVTPRASRDTVEGLDAEGRVRVRVTAPPADGAANKAVSKVLAKALALPQRDIVLTRGARSREKIFEVPLTSDEISQRLRR
jgi:uncharacterized protein